MIHLFPKLKKRMLLICICYIALVGVFIALNPASNPLIILLIALVGLVVVMLAQYLNAVNAHSQLLAVLYNQLNVDGFLKAYEPKLNIKVSNPNIELSVRLHLSNAYCAQGRFDEAMKLLKEFTVAPGKKAEDELLSRFAIASNLCYCAEQKNDLEAAKAYMDELLDLKKQLEALQQTKPEKKRMVFNTELNEQCYNYLTGENVNIELLKRLVQTNTQQLHRVTISLWIAREYLNRNNRREAEKILSQIVKLAPDLYPGKQAAQLLNALPAKAGENAN